MRKGQFLILDVFAEDKYAGNQLAVFLLPVALLAGCEGSGMSNRRQWHPISPSALRPVDEPFGHESFDHELLTEGLKAEWLRSRLSMSLKSNRRSGPKGSRPCRAYTGRCSRRRAGAVELSPVGAPHIKIIDIDIACYP